jgi:hypothetical protein
MKELNTTFDTTKLRVMIESISGTGSAFGASEGGDTVFMNKRLVDRVGLEVGDVVDAEVIPNFEDKRQSIPWRAVRVSKMGEGITPAPVAEEAPARTSADLDQEILRILSETDDEYWTSPDLAGSGATNTDTASVSNSCNRLFQQGLISKADVHARPGQKRASFCLWAIDVSGFK